MESENTNRDLGTLVERAKDGDREALAEIVAAIQNQVYGLALRMLGTPADAEDATQEILIKVVTRLDSFRGDSQFTTWVYAVAANHLRTVKRSAWERRRKSLEQLVEKQDTIPPDARPVPIEHKILVREIRLVCLHALLLTLEREARLTFALGELFDLNGVEGAQVLGIEPDAFRKRLSRARKQLYDFLGEHCGLVRGGNRCSCEYWSKRAHQKGAIDPDNPLLAGHPVSCTVDEDLEARLDALNDLGRMQTLFNTMPDYRAPERLLAALTEILDRPRPPLN